MKEQFVTYEIALRLKELGFDEECFGYYTEQHDGSYFLCVYQEEEEFSKIRIGAPLWQQVIDWFYDKGIFIIISMDITSMWIYQVGPGFPPMEKIIPQWIASDYVYNNPNEAREQAILKVIELCQKERKINLEEILFKHLSKAKEIHPNENWYSDEEIKNSPEFSIFKDAMKEACRQALELAAENAEIEERDYRKNPTKISNYGEEVCSEYEGIYYGVDKQSILDTIKQIE